MIERAIFVLTDREAGQRFLTILPDLLDIGLVDATVLHLVPSRRGPAEPMPELANWVRHFELSVRKVELALKRGDPVRWVYDLARVRDAQLVVLANPPEDADWDFKRVSSPLRALGVPILYVPEHHKDGSLLDEAVIAVKTTATLEREIPRLTTTLKVRNLSAVHADARARRASARTTAGIRLHRVPVGDGVATALLEFAADREATLIIVLGEAENDSAGAESGRPVVDPLIAHADRPVLVWPAAGEGDG